MADPVAQGGKIPSSAAKASAQKTSTAIENLELRRKENLIGIRWNRIQEWKIRAENTIPADESYNTGAPSSISRPVARNSLNPIPTDEQVVDAVFFKALEKAFDRAPNEIDRSGPPSPGVMHSVADGLKCHIDDRLRNGKRPRFLKAEFSHIAVICPRSDGLTRLEDAMTGFATSEQSAKVSVYAPDAFAAYLQSLPEGQASAGSPSEPTVTIRRGYKVRPSYVEVSEKKGEGAGAGRDQNDGGTAQVRSPDIGRMIRAILEQNKFSGRAKS